MACKWGFPTARLWFNTQCKNGSISPFNLQLSFSETAHVTGEIVWFVGLALFVDYIKLYSYIYIYIARASRGLYRDGSSLLRAPSGTEHSRGNNLDLLNIPPKNNSKFNMVGLPILTVVLVSKYHPKRRWLDPQDSESIMWFLEARSSLVPHCGNIIPSSLLTTG